MGLIREPKNIDFHVIDRPWTDEEKKDFSELIKKQKERFQKTKRLLTQKQKAKTHTA